MRLSLQLLVFLFIVIHTNIANNAEGRSFNTEGAVSFGQENLSAILEISGGLNGKIFLDDPSKEHAKRMRLVLTQFIPSQNIVGKEVEAKTPWPWKPEIFANQLNQYAVRVIHTPLNSHIFGSVEGQKRMLQALKKSDVLIVHGTGNIGNYPHDDIFQPEDPFWELTETDDPFARELEYHQMKAFFESGHAVMSNYAIKKPATFEEFAHLISRFSTDEIGGTEVLREMYRNADTYIRYPSVLRFGDMKEYGFAVEFLESKIYIGDPTDYAIRYLSASYASAHVSIFAFYLFQLWDTTAEVVEVMQKTAIDIGEPGPDEEFGWGLINANHPIIWDKSMQRLEQSLSFCLLEDVAFEDAVAIAEKGFDLFYDINGHKKEIGLTYDTGKTTLAVAAGSALRPFGLGSKFLRQQQPTRRTQFALAHSVIKHVSVLGIFGYSRNEDAKVQKGSVGISYQKHLSDKGNLSLYAGYRGIWGTLGLPGYKLIGTGRVPFALHIPEIRTSFGWSF